MKVYKLFPNNVIVQGVRCIDPFASDKMIVIYPNKDTGIKTPLTYSVSELVGEWYETVQQIVDKLILEEQDRHTRRLVEIGRIRVNGN